MKIHSSVFSLNFWILLVSLLLSSSPLLAITAADFRDTTDSGAYTLSDMRLYTYDATGNAIPIENGTVFKGSRIGASVQISANIPGSNGYVSINDIAEYGGQSPGGNCQTYSQVEVNNGVTPKILSMSVDTSITGIVTVYAFVTPYFCNYFGYQYLWSNIISKSINVNPLTATFSNVKLAQTVVRSINDPLPLIQGKSASFAATVDFNSLGNETSFFVEVLSGGIRVAQSQEIQFEPSKTSYEIGPEKFTAPGGSPYVVPVLVSPQTGSQYAFRIVNSNISTTANGFSTSAAKTYAPMIGIAEIQCVPGAPKACYSRVNQSVVDSFLGLKDYLSDLFPVADGAMGLSTTGETIFGAVAGGDAAIDIDFIGLQLVKKTKLVLSSDGLVPLNRVVAVVPQEYFEYHLNTGAVCGQMYGYNDTRSSTIIWNQVGVVSSSCAASFAHELGHTFSLPHFDKAGDLSAIVSEGYNARTKLNVADYVTTGVTGLPNFMKSGEKNIDITKNWINIAQYRTLFEKVKVPLKDPKVIFFGGIVGADGKVTILKSGISETGLVDEDPQGDIAIQIVDKSGTLLSSTSIFSNAFVETFFETEPSSVVELQNIPFLVTLPYDDSARSVKVVKDGVALSITKIGALGPEPTPTPSPSPSPSPTPSPSPSPTPSPTPKVESAVALIKLIPDKAYKVLPAVVKLVLNLEAALFDRLIKSGMNKEALALLRVIEVELKVVLKDSYAVSGTQLTKVQVLRRIESMKLILA